MTESRDDDEHLPAVVAKGEPPIKIARDHASRGPRELVYVNAKGASTSSARANAAVPIIIGGSVVLAAVGAVTWVFPAIMTGWIGSLVLQQRRLMKGNALTLHGRLDEAEKLLVPLATFPLANARFRNMARSTLATIRMRQADYAGALVDRALEREPFGRDRVHPRGWLRGRSRNWIRIQLEDGRRHGLRIQRRHESRHVGLRRELGHEHLELCLAAVRGVGEDLVDVRIGQMRREQHDAGDV